MWDHGWLDGCNRGWESLSHCMLQCQASHNKLLRWKSKTATSSLVCRRCDQQRSTSGWKYLQECRSQLYKWALWKNTARNHGTSIVQGWSTWLQIRLKGATDIHDSACAESDLGRSANRYSVNSTELKLSLELIGVTGPLEMLLAHP